MPPGEEMNFRGPRWATPGQWAPHVGSTGRWPHGVPGAGRPRGDRKGRAGEGRRLVSSWLSAPEPRRPRAWARPPAAPNPALCQLHFCQSIISKMLKHDSCTKERQITLKLSIYKETCQMVKLIQRVVKNRLLRDDF